MSGLERILSQNQQWASHITDGDPEFFHRLSKGQSPEYLWIGCADSRVPANQIVGLNPGEVFVHRNVANLVVHTDLNCLSVMQYAVDVLQVKHIIVCGHYGCGGIAGALAGKSLGLIDNWLHHIQDIAQNHSDALDAIEDEEAKCDRLCELNVIEQAANVCRTTIVREAWSRGQELAVHGCIYRLTDGLLHELGMHVTSTDTLATSYNASIASLIA